MVNRQSLAGCVVARTTGSEPAMKAGRLMHEQRSRTHISCCCNNRFESTTAANVFDGPGARKTVASARHDDTVLKV